MQNEATLPIEVLAQMLETSESFRVLRRLALDEASVLGPEPDMPVKGILLDTETTGLKHGEDRLIELGMVAFEFCALTGRPHRVLGRLCALEDPGIAIPEEASRVNGITDAMVAGQRIDDAAVADFVQGAGLVIAHNAGFDRPFVDERFPVFAALPWACSIKQVPWAALGYSSSKLEFLAYQQGFFYDAHRADADCLALLEVLRKEEAGVPALRHLVEAAFLPQQRLWAVGVPFARKDYLKARGYSWNDGADGREKAWYRDLDSEQLPDELAHIAGEAYGGQAFSVVVETLDAQTRFSNRRGPTRTVRNPGLRARSPELLPLEL